MKRILVIASLALAIVACGDKKEKKGGDASQETTSLSGTIKVDGSSTVFPITEAVAEEFRGVQPKVKVTVGVSGTGGGFKKFSRGETNLSNASRPIKDKEKAACKENNIKYLELEVAYDGLAVIVHPENNWVDHFTVEELKKIWEPAAQGKVMKWNQIRPEWPNEEIHLFGPGVASGTYDYFTEAVVGKSGSSRGDFTASEDDHVLVQGIAGDKYALGFFGLAYYAENKDRLQLIGVHNGESIVKPSLETVKNGTYKPLSRPLFIYVNSTSVSAPEVIEFVDFYIDNAGELSKDVGYIPLPDENYKVQKENFQTFVESNK
ncbi:PstS family phosphate ABC transporter substrate-binding protein [Maribacter sp. HTCC2170]|uniref:PstS family phosphate ABC transporter substrate-binding protein n=1 Tax=Maribacter sp. (strain HTCC2170 / KCCM 42371) TaxID=313603 RepID=UPI00006BD20F|nr:PstS family phosphate ABC transporter substrate-binding protein [Maribacter sp. HTCC2170]EAR02589.1 phosphate ABC transporter, periplasmic phosphate-binding protein [Maribacter sp. HTCC2170]